MNKNDMTATFMGSSVGMWEQNILMAIALGLVTFLANKLWHYLWNKFTKK